MLHKKFLQKKSQKGGGGCLFDVFHDYLENRKQFLRADNTSSKVSSNNQWSSTKLITRTAIVLYFHQRFTSVLRLIEQDMSAYVLKISAIGHSQCDVQIDIDANDSWVRTNHMELAIDESPTQRIGGPERNSRSLQNF